MNRELVIANLIIAAGIIALAVWMMSDRHDGKLIGSRYYEISQEIHQFAPGEAIWDSAGERWVHPDPEPDTDRYITRAAWDRDSERWQYFERDPETGEPEVAAIWHRAAQEWRIAERKVEEEDDPPADADEGDDAAVRYVATDQPHPTALQPIQTWHRERAVPRERANEDEVFRSFSRTFGLWFAAVCTLFVMSFLYRDNPFYKFTEALVVGVSAAYSMVLAFWTMVVPNLFGRLIPEFVRGHISPARDADLNLWYLIVAMLGLMLLWRMSPVGGWIARWPLAFIIGVFAGIRLIAFLEANFAIQIQASILPLFVTDAGGFNFWLSLRNITILLGLMACLTYFFFSIEHKGIVGKTAKLGIYVLMITFGAGFAYTVMGRITLLTQRIEFLVSDWLWLTGG